MQASTIGREQYAEALGLLGAPRKFDEAIASDWAQAALRFLKSKDASPFHWELAYPHVFLTSRNGERPGFDVILGNPPYDVLSEREIGQNIDHLKRFIELDPALKSEDGGRTWQDVYWLRQPATMVHVAPTARSMRSWSAPA